jgi:hypothetical protein
LTEVQRPSRWFHDDFDIVVAFILVSLVSYFFSLNFFFGTIFLSLGFQMSNYAIRRLLCLLMRDSIRYLIP